MTANGRPAHEALVFCLPHAGGSAVASYSTWERDLADLARVIPLELAGRGSRIAEPTHGSLEQAAEDCASRVLAEAGSAPFALFGHSIGGLIAYELDAVLQRRGERRPAAVVISGTPAPNRPRRGPAIHTWPEDRFLAAIERLGGLPSLVLEHRQAREFYCALLRSDYGVVERYRLADPPHRIDAPVLVLLAAGDPVSAPEDPALWRGLAGVDVTIHTLPTDDHFFPATRRAETLAALRAFLQRTLSRPRVSLHGLR